jgi:hypothetical protein
MAGSATNRSGSIAPERASCQARRGSQEPVGGHVKNVEPGPVDRVDVVVVDLWLDQPQPYGSVGVDINCAVIGYTAKAPTANLGPPAPTRSSPPR